MIIQNINLSNQAAQADRLVSNDAPKVVADTARQPVSQQPLTQNLKSAVDSVNQALRHSNQSLEISVDSATKQPVVKLKDTQTGELIRQIPSKEMLAIAQSIDEFLQRGQLLSEKA